MGARSQEWEIAIAIADGLEFQAYAERDWLHFRVHRPASVYSSSMGARLEDVLARKARLGFKEDGSWILGEGFVEHRLDATQTQSVVDYAAAKLGRLLLTSDPSSRPSALAERAGAGRQAMVAR